MNALRNTCPHPGAVHTKGRSSPIADKCSAKQRKEWCNFISFLKKKIYAHVGNHTADAQVTKGTQFNELIAITATDNDCIRSQK